jgi:RimJ/RimL family protein N-acetyltransferase
MPCVEAGWRLARAFWGRGVGFEAARQAVDFGLGQAGLDELVSFTSCGNLRSRRLMERLGFFHDPAGNFLHPTIPAGHELRPHVLYRKRAPRRG